ncbi:MAG: alpha/beta hydrolase [Alphaproteobacteria bacterium]|nr:alpha/beta hydrolase [Alphaproteobacteria bacterium]
MTRAITQVSRRSVLAGLAAGAGLGAVMPAIPAPARAAAPKKHVFLLVHGAWHGGWSYGPVERYLAGDGHRVLRPTLTGLAERSHLLDGDITLDTHITDIVNLIQWENLENVVLCGHSYGGWVIGGVAERLLPRISSIVFLDAYIPQDGRAFVDSLPRATRTAVRRLARQGALSIPPPPARTFKLNTAHLAWVDSKLTAQPIRTWLQQIRVTGAQYRVPKKTYIRASGFNSPAFRDIHARLKRNPAWRTYEMPCGHDAMIDMPERLAEILAEVA